MTSRSDAHHDSPVCHPIQKIIQVFLLYSVNKRALFTFLQPRNLSTLAALSLFTTHPAKTLIKNRIFYEKQHKQLISLKINFKYLHWLNLNL